jgi:hypothetical protein
VTLNLQQCLISVALDVFLDCLSQKHPTVTTIMVFWDVTPCSSINTFLGNVVLQCSFLYLQDRDHSFLLNFGVYTQYTVYCNVFFPTFRKNLSVQSSLRQPILQKLRKKHVALHEVQNQFVNISLTPAGTSENCCVSNYITCYLTHWLSQWS